VAARTSLLARPNGKTARLEWIGFISINVTITH
jgi:hypothetical protein